MGSGAFSRPRPMQMTALSVGRASMLVRAGPMPPYAGGGAHFVSSLTAIFPLKDVSAH
jgi:hypothetical protein